MSDVGAGEGKGAGVRQRCRQGKAARRDRRGAAGDGARRDGAGRCAYDDTWRIVGTWRGADTDPKEAFTYHNAGLAGRGGSSYIDSVVLRDRDMNGGGGWTGACDGTLEARHYYAQNWRADVSGIFDNKGAVLEWVKYSAYGVPHLLTPGDHDKSGEVDKDDETAFNADYGTGNLRADLDEDGDVDADDQKLFTASYNKTTPGGRWKLSAEDVGNRKGYAGYEHEGFGNDLAAPEIAHVRHRVLHFGLGRWTRRDPLGYVDGMNEFAYGRHSPMVFHDPFGLRAGPCAKQVLQRAATHTPPTPCDLDGNPFPIPHPPVRLLPDPGCNILNECLLNASVLSALSYMLSACSRNNNANTPCGSSWRIACRNTGGGNSSCRTCTITVDPSEGCGTLAHELIHAGDQCLLGCPQTGPADGFVDCNQWMCSEYRAIHAACCNWSGSGVFTSYNDCVSYYQPWYQNPSNNRGCSNLTDWALVASCCGGNEADCGNSTPPFPKDCLTHTVVQ